MSKLARRLHVAEAFEAPENEEAELFGWVRNKRVHGGLVFLELRDSTGTIQVTVKRGFAEEDSFKEALDVTRESSVVITGIIKKDPRAPGGTEIHCRSFKVIGKSIAEFPIKPGASVKFLLDNRHLHLRSPKVTAVMKIRSLLTGLIHEWFRKNGFTEIHCPTFITAAVEGGATLFKVDYFGRNVYLTQSVQFYQEAAIFGLEKVYTIQPSFRAELSRTRRHLTEFWHVEAEMANATLEDMMAVVERLVGDTVKALAESAGPYLKILGKSINPSVAEPPYPRIKYAEALEILRRKGFNIEWGQDFGADEERELSKEFNKPFFVTHYPKEAKAFYHMPDPSDPRVTLSADLLAPGGYGEIVGGGQRIHDYELLVQRIKEAGLNPSDYEWYLDLRKYGSIPHSGFGLGLERMLWWLLGMVHIRSVTLFPRTPARVYP
ncbi:MAG: asparagine--tRNA ligase [Nitrososphaerota archaeon]